MAERLAGLLQRLGWVSLEGTKEDAECEEEKEVKSSLLGDSQRGITLISHSKYVLSCLSSGLYQSNI